MKSLYFLFLILISVAALGQVSNTKVVRVANASTVFSEPLSEGNILIDLNSDKTYLVLKPIASTNSISDLTVDVDYKEIANADPSATDSTFVWVQADTLFVGSNIAAVDSATGVKINENLVIEADGTIRMDNEATVWEDLNVFPDAVNVKQGDVNAPAYLLFKNDGASSVGVYLNCFANGKDQEVFFTVQLPHSYREGSDLHPHVHWTAIAGTPARSGVKWGLEYTIVSIGETFGNTTIITGSNIINNIATITGPGQHLINSLGIIDGSPGGNPLKISSVIACRLFRDDDTFTESVGLLGIDFHYESDTQGSRVEYIK